MEKRMSAGLLAHWCHDVLGIGRGRSRLMPGLFSLIVVVGLLPAIASANPWCGDGKIQAGEGCDDGNQLNGDGCTDHCLLPNCGDGVLDRGEPCDDGNLVEGDGCQNTCLRPYCGDGVHDVDMGEACDHGMSNSDTTPNECRTDCVKPHCGDGVLDPLFNELCDDGNTVGGDGCSAACRHEGCPPKFWMETKHVIHWGAYLPAQRFNAVFGVHRASDPTLLEALSMTGVEIEAVLGRHAVAALLNAASEEMGYWYTVDEVIAMVREAYATGELQRIKNHLSKENFSDCPL